MIDVNTLSKPVNKEKISQAIKLAWWMVSFPSILAMLGTWGIYAALIKMQILSSLDEDTFLWALLFGLGGFVLAWLVWSVQVPKWRLQAYIIVDDIEALKQEAVARQIIWPNGSIFEKTEIASKSLREKISEVERGKKRSTELRETGGIFKTYFRYFVVMLVGICCSILARSCTKAKYEKPIIYDYTYPPDQRPDQDAP